MPAKTEAGALQGVAAETGTAFLGIPFAAPPIGSLRWKAPAPVAPWVGIRMADHTGPACKQDSRIPPAERHPVGRQAQEGDDEEDGEVGEAGLPGPHRYQSA